VCDDSRVAVPAFEVVQMPVPRPAIPHAVDRPALRARLDAGHDAPLTLVVAPAGSGKSVLLAQWVATLRGVRVAWLDLTDADDDPVSLLRSLTSELVALDPAFLELEHAPRPAAAGLGRPLLEAVAACFAAASVPVVLVLDDVHRLTNRELVDDLWQLVDLLPPGGQLVLSSRVDLAIGRSRHRLRHATVELREADLAMDAATTAAVIERITRRSVDDATAEAIVAHTEGWAAGVQLTGLGLRFRPDAREFLDALADGERLALEYLSEEVLDAQPRGTREALLALSVLDDFTPALAETVAGIDDGVAFVRGLERDSMFVHAVPGAPGTYRFHHLFRDLLRRRLQATDPSAEPRLLSTAAEWYVQQDQIPAAIEALLAGRHGEAALDLIVTRGRDVYERGATTTVARWLERVPEEIRLTRPDAQLMYAILEGMSGRAGLAEMIARELLAGSDTTPGLRVVAKTYLAGCVQFLPHPQTFLSDGLEAQELLDTVGSDEIPDIMRLSTPPNLRVFASVSIARAYFLLGQVATARRHLVGALESTDAVYGPYRIHGLGSLALVEAWDGRLRRATELADEALELARQLDLLTHPAPADAYLARSLVAIQRGEPEIGAFALHEGYVRAASNARHQLMWIAHAQARLVDPRGTESSAAAPATPAPPIVKDAMEGLARRLQREAGAPAAPSHATSWSRVAYEDVAGMIARGDTDAARTRLAEMSLPDPAPPVAFVDVQLLRAWAAAVDGRTGEARERVQRALNVAEPEDLVKPFLRAGDAIVAIVRALPGPAEGLRRRILDRAAQGRRAPAQQLAEPLTARELELLAYLPSRMTNAELATACFVSLNTVKTHMAHIYRKLDANGRDAAIVRARELGLLETPVGAL
jgi:LuxR family maltose regulon positive regulatory protein